MVHDVQAILCAYVSPGGNGRGPSGFCDCKYGATERENGLGRGESGNGCPEMRWLARFLSLITDIEYSRIVKRMSKKPKKSKVSVESLKDELLWKDVEIHRLNKLLDKKGQRAEHTH